MSHSVRTTLSVIVRLVTAGAVLILLTATVLQHNDHDGYQATHLIFMPREAWEMDGGVGMLHDADYYVPAAGQDLDADALGYLPFTVQASPASYSTQDAVEADQGVIIRDASSAQRITVSHGGPLESLAGNTIPVEQSGADFSWELGQAFLLLFIALSLTIWLGDIPTPPPRFKIATKAVHI